MGFNCLKARATSRGSLLFTTKFPEIPGTNFIDLSQPWSHPVVFEDGTPGLGIQRLNH